ncbi:MAG: hypothetical protein KDA24_27570 [Deltaproteobacteria bacterium]|nr:hypothetical protein [Deltaproteobacteria bacterium]
MDGGNWKEMFYAVEADDIELLRYHLRMGIDPNFQHPEVLSTPLVESAGLGRVEMVKLLLDSGADPTIEAAWERTTALQAAETHGQREVAGLLRKHLGLPPRTTWWQRLLRRAPTSSSMLGSCLALQVLGGCAPPVAADGDGDGVAPEDGDCDDADPNVLPGAEERCGDGIDSDCDGEADPFSSVRFTDGSVSIPDDPALDLGDVEGTARTVEAWFRVAGAQGGDEVVLIDKRGAAGQVNSAGTDYSVRLLRNGDAWQVAASVGPDTDFCAWEVTVGPVEPDTWHHVAFAVEVGAGAAGTKTTWLDGALADTCAFTAKGPATGQALLLGASVHPNPSPFEGWIDAVRISQGVRYSGDFTPDSALGADADTVALWALDGDAEDAVGSRDGAVSAGTDWSREGACSGS